MECHAHNYDFFDMPSESRSFFAISANFFEIPGEVPRGQTSQQSYWIRDRIAAFMLFFFRKLNDWNM